MTEQDKRITVTATERPHSLKFKNYINTIHNFIECLKQNLVTCCHFTFFPIFSYIAEMHICFISFTFLGIYDFLTDFRC